MNGSLNNLPTGRNAAPLAGLGEVIDNHTAFVSLDDVTWYGTVALD